MIINGSRLGLSGGCFRPRALSGSQVVLPDAGSYCRKYGLVAAPSRRSIGRGLRHHRICPSPTAHSTRSMTNRSAPYSRPCPTGAAGPWWWRPPWLSVSSSVSSPAISMDVRRVPGQYRRATSSPASSSPSPVNSPAERECPRQDRKPVRHPDRVHARSNWASRSPIRGTARSRSTGSRSFSRWAGLRPESYSAGLACGRTPRAGAHRGVSAAGDPAGDPLGCL